MKPLYLLICITYFVEHFDVSRSELIPRGSSEKPAVTSWISGGDGVRRATSGIRILVAQSVVRYVDVLIPTIKTKSGSVVGTTIHCFFLILIPGQLNRIISFVVVKREYERFAGCRVVARSWSEEKCFKHCKYLGCKQTLMKKNCIARRVGRGVSFSYGLYRYPGDLVT